MTYPAIPSPAGHAGPGVTPFFVRSWYHCFSPVGPTRPLQHKHYITLMSIYFIPSLSTLTYRNLPLSNSLDAIEVITWHGLSRRHRHEGGIFFIELLVHLSNGGCAFSENGIIFPSQYYRTSGKYTRGLTESRGFSPHNPQTP